jgi:hypothetical protein
MLVHGKKGAASFWRATMFGSGGPIWVVCTYTYDRPAIDGTGDSDS